MNFPKIDSPLARSYVDQVVSSIKNRIQDGSITSLEQLRAEAYSSFIKVFEDIARVKLNTKPFEAEEFRNSLIWNHNVRAIDRALTTLFNEALSLNTTLVAQHNLITASSKNVEAKANKLNERLNELVSTVEKRQFFSKGKSVTVFEDSFVDTDNVDFTKTQGVIVDASTTSVMLQPDINVNRGNRVTKIELIENNHRTVADGTLFEEDGLPRKPSAYEGKRFGLVGQARPQLNSWNIETKNTRLDKANPDVTIAKPDDNIQTYYVNLNKERYGSAYDNKTYYTGPTTHEVDSTVTTYDIKDELNNIVAKDAQSVNENTTKILGWTTSDGRTITVSSTDTKTYSYTTNSKTVKVTTPYTLEELAAKEAAAKAASSSYSAAKGENPNEILEENSSGYSVKNLGLKRITPEEYIFDDYDVNPANVKYLQDGANKFANTFTREDFVYVEVTPAESDLERARYSMFDSNPQTFWEIEYTPMVGALGDKLIHSTLSGVSSTPLDAETSPASYSKYQSLAATYLNTNSPDDLTITLRIELDSAYWINYLDLDPVFFENIDTANIEVLKIVTQESESAQENPVSIDNGFIGRNSNASLSDSQLDFASVSNRFGFKAKGFWAFDRRKVKIIKITIKQDNAVVNPYQVKIVQLLKKSQYTINQSKSRATNTSSGFKTTTDEKSGSGSLLERGRVSSTIQFGYLETILDHLKAASTELLAGTTADSSISTNSSSGVDTRKSSGTGGLGTIIGGSVGTGVASGIAASGGFTSALGAGIAGGLIAAAGAAIDLLASKGSSSSSSNSVSNSFSDSGLRINSSYYKTIFARPRYAIGIRDIGIFSKTFVEAGQLVSKKYQTTAGNKRLYLKVEHVIPQSFVRHAPGQAYLSYFIIIKGSPVALAPIKAPPPSQAYEGLPAFIDLSQYGTDQDILDIYFVAKMHRPLESSVRNAESESPILKKYTITIEST